MSHYTPSYRTSLIELIQHKTKLRGGFASPRSLNVDANDVAQRFFDQMGQYQLDLQHQQSLWRMREMINHITR